MKRLPRRSPDLNSCLGRVQISIQWTVVDERARRPPSAAWNEWTDELMNGRHLMQRCACSIAVLAACAQLAGGQTTRRLPPVSQATYQAAISAHDTPPALGSGGAQRLPVPSGTRESVSAGPLLGPQLGQPGAPQPPGALPTQLIDLPAALRLADRANPEIGITRQAILESMAILQGAKVLLVPSIRGGANYHDHNGSIQRSNGTIFNLPEEQSLFFGAGARTVGGRKRGLSRHPDLQPPGRRDLLAAGRPPGSASAARSMPARRSTRC